MCLRLTKKIVIIILSTDALLEIIVNKGTLLLDVDNTTYTLNEGDSIVFDSSKNHSYSNITNTTLEMTVINNYII